MLTLTMLLALAADPPKFSDLPVKVASLGACKAGDWIYAYGGHAGKMHEYDEKTASNRFFRAKITGGKWEELPSGPRCQGTALVAHGNTVIRIGGMQPRNKAGDPADNHSLKSAARYDPAARKWAALPDMPSGRSSHDAVVIGDKLYVVGGWEMAGKDSARKWHENGLVLDLAAKTPAWKEFKQPFKRRALGAAAVGGKIYVVGGLGTEKSTGEIDIYDPAAGKWAKAPDLPGSDKHGFSPAAAESGGRLYVSTSDGQLSRLKADGSGWENAGKTSKRLVHRLVPGADGKLILIGGGVTEVEVTDPSAASSE